MIKVKSVSVDQAEGRIDRLVSGVFNSICDANSALREISRRIEPGKRGYYKTDVSIEWEDGTEHGFRCDVDCSGTDTNLTAMLQGWAERYKPGATERNLKHLLDSKELAAWEKQAARILAGELETV